MNNKIVFSWAFLSFSIMVVFCLLWGVLFGFHTTQILENIGENVVLLVINKYMEMLGFFFQIIGTLFFAVFFWAFISLKWPVLETGKIHFFVFSLYCFCFGIFFSLIIANGSPFSVYGGVFIVLSIFLPRLILKSLDEWISVDKSEFKAMKSSGGE
jgi:drug/metabolite transporter superfamily protein YnfA